MTRFQFVADHRDAFEVKRMCQLVEVCRSAFYAWEAGADARAARAEADEALAARVRAVHAAFGLDSEDGEAVVYAGTGR